MPDYLTIKHIHMGCAALSGSLFLLRGCWMLAGSGMLARRWVRTFPHLIDSVLLASALTLAFWSGQSPTDSPWLAAKIVALLAYILLGTVALKRGKTKTLRASAFVAALAVYGYIVSVALTRNPLPFAGA